MEQISILTKRRKRSGAGRLTRNSKIFKAIISAVQEKKAENIISLDLRKIPEAVADFFIICDAGTYTQIKAIGDNVETQVKEITGETPFHREGQQGMNWILVDYVNIVVHIMQTDTRKFYKLEEMWSDADGESHDG